MNPIVFHFASGHAFFTGTALLLLSAGLSCFGSDVVKRITVGAFIFGVAIVVISAAPIPYWCYGLTGLGAIAWGISYFYEAARIWCRIGFALSCVIPIGFEIPYHVYWGVDESTDRRVAIVGDSITAGMGGSDRSRRWPDILSEDHRVEVIDLSNPGETVSSAHKQLHDRQINASLVIVEIGGNDLLGSTSSSDFRADLDELLGHLAKRDRQIIMFELPLPPLRNEYGRMQRQLASRHNVVLIPKRILMGILAPRENTVDTVHLTQEGHDAMARIVWGLIKPAY